jgi:hypothetical protein
VEKSPKALPNPFFRHNEFITGLVEKSSPRICATSVNSAQRKQSPNIRKFAQSGHPARNDQVSRMQDFEKKTLK